MKHLHLSLVLIACVLIVSACGTSKKLANPPDVSGALSGLFATDALIVETTGNQIVRHAATLGIFTSEYLSFAATSGASQGALTGIAIDQVLMDSQKNVTDPDFDLLQAFGDALQVDVADLLNRSADRQQSLEVYTNALMNVANRANERFRELSAVMAQLKATLQTQNKELSTAERNLKTAISKKLFSDAGELQKIVNEKQQAAAETDLKYKQIEDIVDTFDKLLTLYGEKILAIQQNREVLIAGIKAVDVPGAEELQVLQRQKATRTSGRGGEKFDDLFNE